MLWNAKNRQIEISGYTTDFISFGNGEENLIIIPGLGDGLKTAKGTAIPFAFQYRMFVKRFKVFVFSRKNNLPTNYSTRQMAADIHQAMEQLGIKQANVVGVSMGGMIAQYLAIDYPENVKKLVLVVTLARQNRTLDQAAESWIRMAHAGDYRGLMLDTAEKSYTDTYLKRNKWMLSLLTKIGQPKDFNRFITMAHACMSHNAFDELYRIKCPTLVIGGWRDKILTGVASVELAERIKGSELLMYEQFGHALYEEADDFNRKVVDFL